MVCFSCPKCLREFDRKYNLDTHLNKKFDCSINRNKNINDRVNFNEKKIIIRKTRVYK